MATWPEGIPFFDLRSGYGAQPGDNVLRTPMDVGPAKVRRRATSAPSIITGAAYMTREQAQRFEAFWRDTLKDGALSFTLADGLWRRRNLLVQSEDFSAGWTITNAVRSNAASVLPGQIASAFAISDVAAVAQTWQGKWRGGETYTFTAVAENIDATSARVELRRLISTSPTPDAVVYGIQFDWATGSVTVREGSGLTTVTSLGTGPNGGAMFRASVKTSRSSAFADADGRVRFYPANSATTAGSILHWAQVERAPAFTQYEPVGASYRSKDVTRGGTKSFRIVGVPDFGLMGLGHRVPVTLEVLP